MAFRQVRMKETMARWFQGLLSAVGGIFLLTATMLASQRLVERQAYDDLHESAVESFEKVGTTDGIDWDSLRIQNPDIAGWLRVEGTPIDYPVVQIPMGSKRDSSYYLSHDFWKRRSFAGCPYLDERASTDGSHALIYGHHLGFSHEMFSPIFRAWKQEEFDGLGDAIWMTPNGGQQTFQPLCSLKVDASFAPIQEFAFPNDASFRTWLLRLVEQATARTKDARERVRSANRALTLITCASTIGGQRARTLVVFAAEQ